MPLSSDKIKRGRQMAHLKGSNMVVQSIIFPKNSFNKRSAQSWLEKNGYRNRKVDEKPNSLRYRQINPHKIKRDSFVSIKLPDGVVLIRGKKNQ